MRTRLSIVARLALFTTIYAIGLSNASGKDAESRHSKNDELQTQDTARATIADYSARKVWIFPVEPGFKIGGLRGPDGIGYSMVVDPIMPNWSDLRDKYAFRYHRPFEGVTHYKGHLWNDAGQGMPYGRDLGSSVRIVFRGPMFFGLIIQSDKVAWTVERNLYEPTYRVQRVDVYGMIDQSLVPTPLLDTVSAREWKSNHHGAPCVWSSGNNAVGYELDFQSERMPGMVSTAQIRFDSGTSDWASFGVQGWMPAPEIVFPAKNDTLYAGDVTFVWKNPCDEIAVFTPENPPTGPILRTYTRKDLKPGTYFWSLTAKSRGNGRSRGTSQRQLVIVQRPKIIEPKLALRTPSRNDTIGPGDVDLAWETIDVRTVEVQLRGAIEIDNQIDSASSLRTNLNPGVYWWRARIVDASGSHPWVEWRHFVVARPEQAPTVLVPRPNIE